MRSDWSDDDCPVARGIDAVGDPWTLLVLREALAGARRFEEFRARLGVAENVLSSRLRRMVDSGLLERLPYASGNRTRLEYRITAAGADVLPILHSFARWAQAHTPTDEGNRLGVVCRACGQDTGPQDACSHCGQPLASATVSWRRPGAWLGTTTDLVTPSA